MAEFSNKELKLVSQEGETFTVPAAVAAMSALVKEMIPSDDDSDAPEGIPLPNVSGAVLSKVVEYCTEYQKDAMTEFEKVAI